MDALCLLIWQVFVNTVSVGFLDYERKKIVIPLVQVCYPGELHQLLPEQVWWEERRKTWKTRGSFTTELLMERGADYC